MLVLFSRRLTLSVVCVCSFRKKMDVLGNPLSRQLPESPMPYDILSYSEKYALYDCPVMACRIQVVGEI